FFQAEDRIRDCGALGFVDSRQGIRKLEIAARTHGHFLLRPRIRWRRVCRVRPLHARSRLRAPFHRTCGTADRGKRARRGTATPRRGAIPDVDVATAKFAPISGENEREYPETYGLDAHCGGSFACRALPTVVRGRREF